MGRPLIAVYLCLAALVLAWAGASSAVADSFDDVYNDYQADGSIDACAHSPGSLGTGVPNDIAEYAPDFQGALKDAQRRRGGCGGSRASVRGSVGGSSVRSTGPGGRRSNEPPKPPPVPQRSTATGSTATLASEAIAATPQSTAVPLNLGGGGVPLPVALLGLLGGTLLVSTGMVGVGRYFGWGFQPLAPLRHGLAEGGMRIGSSAGGLVDWLRERARRSP